MGADAGALLCFGLAAIAGALLYRDLRPRNYTSKVFRMRARSHKYTQTPGQPNSCSKCFEPLGKGNHRGLSCQCGYRVGGERCICTKDRDRWTEPLCPWCRDGKHFTAGDPLGRLPQTLTKEA